MKSCGMTNTPQIRGHDASEVTTSRGTFFSDFSRFLNRGHSEEELPSLTRCQFHLAGICIHHRSRETDDG